MLTHETSLRAQRAELSARHFLVASKQDAREALAVLACEHPRQDVLFGDWGGVKSADDWGGVSPQGRVPKNPNVTPVDDQSTSCSYESVAIEPGSAAPRALRAHLGRS